MERWQVSTKLINIKFPEKHAVSHIARLVAKDFGILHDLEALQAIERGGQRSRNPVVAQIAIKIEKVVNLRRTKKRSIG